MIIFGIETSCDETAASIVEGRGDRMEVLSSVVSSQIEIHKKYGGVVPEVAAREHVLNIIPVVDKALAKSGINPLNPPLQGGRVARSPFQRGAGGLDAIAVTVGPGLVTSLLVGVETAKTLSYAWRVPVVAVNHIEGHIYANFIGANPKSKITNKIKFPALILTVSGGHTMLVLMSGHGKYKALGETRDDAAGEAFDKAASLLQLGYPGGPEIAKWAKKYSNDQRKISKSQFPISKQIPISNFQTNAKGAIVLPRPMLNSNDFDFSFSGLKTALLYAVQRDKNWEKNIPEYAYGFEQAATEVLVHKTIKAALKYNVKNITLSGGVAANQELRRKLAAAVKEKLPGAVLNIPEFKYCTDNAAMIAAAGYFRAKRKDFTPWQKLKTDPNKALK